VAEQRHQEMLRQQEARKRYEEAELQKMREKRAAAEMEAGKKGQAK